jgi:hypothetical protein
MSNDAFKHICEPLSVVLKEISRRAELRPRLEAELGRPLSDQEFIAMAEATGLKI